MNPIVLEYDFDQSIGYVICNAWQALQQALNEELSAQGITFRQWQVLACLALMQEAAQGDIAERLGIENATLVGVLDRMERDGWIRRHPCPADRRKKLIRATRKVEPVWAKMVQCAHRVRQRAISGVDAKDFATACEVLRQIQRNLQSIPKLKPKREARKTVTCKD
jgi:MarR family transcriptional regulator for hemolysin